MTRPGVGGSALSVAPARSALILLALIVSAGVANMNMSVANVSLPDIGKALSASQVQLNLIAVGFTAGLACSVTYLGALGDRFGRRKLLFLGLVLSIPACLVASFAQDPTVLIGARFVGGIAAGMAYPTTLAIITVLWTGPARGQAIALWSGLGFAITTLGPLLAGWLLTLGDWRLVFLITLPLAAVALVLVMYAVPKDTALSSERVDAVSGISSMALVLGIVLAVNLAAMPGALLVSIICAVVSGLVGVFFFLRQRLISYPLFDLKIAGRPVYWVALVAGMLVFGALMGAMYIGQQYLQNVLGYDPLLAATTGIAFAVPIIVSSPISSVLVQRRGTRFTMILGIALCVCALALMIVLWRPGGGYWSVIVCYLIIGVGVGLAGTASTSSLTNAVPASRSGMASAAADLQRDLGGAIMQSLLGAFLTAGYGSAVAKHIASAPHDVQQQITGTVTAELQNSYSSAAEIASRYPDYSAGIIDAARESFVVGQDWAYIVGLAAMVAGLVLVIVKFPTHAKEIVLIDGYRRSDETSAASRT